MTEPRWKDLAQARGLDVQIHKDIEDTPPVSGSPRDSGEMLANLLLNAVEAMTESGTITVGARAQDGIVRLTVADTGCGMTDEVARRCTEPFYSTKGSEGSGLGLSTVRGVVKRHGGTLAIESVPGVGTTVTVDLPVWPITAPDAEPAPEVGNAAQAARPAGRRRRDGGRGAGELPAQRRAFGGDGAQRAGGPAEAWQRTPSTW